MKEGMEERLYDTGLLPGAVFPLPRSLNEGLDGILHVRFSG